MFYYSSNHVQVTQYTIICKQLNKAFLDTSMVNVDRIWGINNNMNERSYVIMYFYLYSNLSKS